MNNNILYSPIVNENIYNNNDFSNSTTTPSNQDYQISIDPGIDTMAKVNILNKKIIDFQN